ncbi:MAG: site-specific DNA-methyltransferase, partial [Rhabdaerophilum calidifontis]
EHGFVNAGDYLISPDGRARARVRADGSIVFRDAAGSIHRVGAIAAGAPACNGWTFWTLERDGVPIDLFRREIRKRMGAATGL